MSLEIWDLTASASYKQKAEGTETHDKVIIHQDTVKSAVVSSRNRIAQQVNIIGKC
jgi:hypothetical protein